MTGRRLRQVGLVLPMLAMAMLSGGAVPATAQRAASNLSVRAELASVLLQAGRYDEAAGEYSRLLARDPRNRSYRLNLARALAWGRHPRSAERQLQILLRDRPGDAEVRALLVDVRESYEPSASEASQWVGERPAYAPYRLALARALVRDGHPRLAIEQYELLLRGGHEGRAPSRSALRAEQVQAYAAAGDRPGAIRMLRELLVNAPGDTAIRHALAVMLADDGQLGASLAEYDALIATAPTAQLYVERAYVHVLRKDTGAAHRDLASSLRFGRTFEAYLLLGDMHREAGEHVSAREAYRAALAMPGPPSQKERVERALAHLSREARPAVALVPDAGVLPGVRAAVSTSSDNLGLRLNEATARAGVSLRGTVLSVEAGTRRLDLSADSISASSSGRVLAAAVSRAVERGPWLTRGTLRAGSVDHGEAGSVGEASLDLSVWRDAWQFAVRAARGAAYPSLFTYDALVPADDDGPLVQNDLMAAIALPVGPLDGALSIERSWLSDGNVRTTLQAYTRLPLRGNLFAVYSGTSQGFSQRSGNYWDPVLYQSHGAGLEYARRQPRGLSFAARILPTLASTEEIARAGSPFTPLPPGVSPGDVIRRNAVQLVAGGEAAYRFADAWELGGALSYGRGRAGDYSRAGAAIALRWAP